MEECIRNGDLTGVKRLVLEDLNNRDARFGYAQQPAVALAARKGHLHVVTWLLEVGADVNVGNRQNWTALMDACQEGQAEIARVLLEHGAQVDFHSSGGWNGLLWACRLIQQVVQVLLEYNANVNVQSPDGLTPLMFASGVGHLEIATMLIERGALLNTPSEIGRTALMWASQGGHVAIVRLLLERGATFYLRDNQGFTASRLASKPSVTEAIRFITESEVAKILEVDLGLHRSIAFAFLDRGLITLEDCETFPLEKLQALLRSCSLMNEGQVNVVLERLLGDLTLHREKQAQKPPSCQDDTGALFLFQQDQRSY